MADTTLDEIHAACATGAVIPYIGPGVLSLDASNPLPKCPAELVAGITAQSPVPGKLRNNLGGAAQFIENFKHRITLKRAMTAVFSQPAEPNALHQFIAKQTGLRAVVYAWYDSLLHQAFARRENWFLLQGVSRADHREIWYRCFDAKGIPASDSIAEEPDQKHMLLYAPLGGVWPEADYLVSDSDYVEVLTEIDIQTPIPPVMQKLRMARNFLFLGCRFNTQLERQMAHQIIKRSSDRHWAVLAEEPTKNEERFLVQHNIERIPLPLAAFVECCLCKGLLQ